MPWSASSPGGYRPASHLEVPAGLALGSLWRCRLVARWVPKLLPCPRGLPRSLSVSCRFCDDIEWMTGQRPGLYWRLSWWAVSPMLLLGILLAYIVLLVQRPPSYKAWSPQYVGTSPGPHSAIKAQATHMGTMGTFLLLQPCGLATAEPEATGAQGPGRAEPTPRGSLGQGFGQGSVDPSSDRAITAAPYRQTRATFPTGWGTSRRNC